MSAVRDGERLTIGVKDAGAAEIFPQTLKHNSNGRFVVACGDGEYIIYTAMALRNKAFGSAVEFVWSHNASEYAIREGTSTVKIHNNFKEKKSFKPEFGAEQIFTGPLLGVRGGDSLAFYDWDDAKLIRRIELSAEQIFWSENHDMVALCSEESFFILRYNAEYDGEPDEDGYENAFDVVGETNETVKTGVWVGDCFIFTNSLNRLNYYVGGEIVTVAHLERPLYLLGYLPEVNRVFLADKELNIVSYSIELSVLEYQTAVMRRDFETADKVLPTLPKEQRTRVAHFLEKQGFKKQALAVSTDPEHKFDLAIQLGDLATATTLAKESASEQKWKQLAELATSQAKFTLAQQCLHEAQDHGGLLLLATAAGNADMVSKLGASAEEAGKHNVSFLSYFLLGDLERCLEILITSNRIPEAAFFARTYLPSEISRVVALWRVQLGKVNEKAGQSLADPADSPNLFPDYQASLQAQQMLARERANVIPASDFKEILPNHERNPLEELSALADEEGEQVEEEKEKTPRTAEPSREETPAAVAGGEARKNSA